MALLHRPNLLILDEPTSGLDPHATRVFLNIITEHVQAGAAVLFSTHLLDQAERLCHRAAIIAEGRLLAVDTLENLRRRFSATGSLENIFFTLTGDDG